MVGASPGRDVEVSEPRVSVVVPTHDRAELLKVALSGVAQQTALPDEIIIVDDLGDAATEQAVAQFAATSEFPVRYVHNQGTPGGCSSRNLGASIAAHGWLAFLDDDDFWRPRHLELLRNRASGGDVQWVVSGLTRLQTGRPDEVRVMKEGLTPGNLFHSQGGMTGSNFLIDRAAFDAVRGFDLTIPMYDDWDLFARLLQANYRYGVSPDPTAEWRDHGGARVTSPSLDRARSTEKFVERYGHLMAGPLLRSLKRTALGIRRRHAASPRERFKLAVQLTLAYTPQDLGARILERIRKRQPVA